jgi:hypothetical protein
VFSPATIEAIKCYVYVLTDEADRIFYVGKGQGNRIFAHVEEVRRLLREDPQGVLQKSEDDDVEQDGLGLKRQRIANILQQGKAPGMYIVREGMSPEQALLMEAALISVLDWQLAGNLTNQVAGQGTSHFGLKTVEELEATKGEPFRIATLPDIASCDEVIAINVNRRWSEVVTGQATLLEVSQGVWKLSKKRASKCPYAIIHANGIVRGVFKISSWSDPDADGKYAFESSGPQPLAGRDFKDKNASSLFGAGGSGSQNPIRYVRIPS